jgi:hypothetical protein
VGRVKTHPTTFLSGGGGGGGGGAKHSYHDISLNQT